MIIKNAHCALPGHERLVKRDLRVSGEKIQAISERLEATPGEELLDAEGLELFPGAIDPHVHFNEPGFTHHEDFYHGSMAAARGGVTTVIDMPCTSLPPVTTLENLKEKLSAMGSHSVIDYGLYAGVSGNHIEQALAEDMAKLAPEVLGFKCYFVSGMDTFTAVDHFSFGRAIAKAAELKRPLLLHAEDAGVVLPATKAAKQKAQTEDRDATWDDYVSSRPEAAERVAAAAALTLAQGIEGTLHVVHVGTAEAAELLSRGGASCETCPHYLAFSSADFAEKGSALKTSPPVKAPGHAQRLWAMLADGRIAFVTSDHAPATYAEKHSGSIWTDYGGIPGTGTVFPYLYSEGYRAGRLSLSALLRATGGAAAKRFGLSGGKGSLEPGKDADFILVDPNASYTVRGTELLSKGSITPFEGMKLQGKIIATYVRGRPVWKANDENPAAGIVTAIGYGKHLTWGYQ
jgi:allantoinase